MKNLPPLVDPWPPWAAERANGKWLMFAQLPTKDGRKTGNAVIADWTYSKEIDTHVALVITDAGNVMRLTLPELEELFHTPEFVTKSLLPAQHKALIEEPL